MGRIGDSMLPEFDQEMSNTRKTLERVPDEKFGWKPHEKSFAMGPLASHLANLPSWANIGLGMDEFDMAPNGVPMKTPECHSREEVLKTFDQNVAAARAAIADTGDEKLFSTWSLLSNGNKVLTLPKIAVLRSFVMNHMIH